MQAAWDALERNDFRFAEAAAREALVRSPGDGEALYLLGSTFLFEGRAQEALEPLANAARTLYRRGVNYRLGHCHLALGDFARAEEVLRRETQAYPESANARNTLGVALVNLERRVEALDEFLAALKLEPGHAEASNNAGNALLALGRPDEALPYAQRAVAAAPQLVDAQLNLGMVLRALQRFEEGAAQFARVLALAPDTPYALGLLVWCRLFTCDWHALESDIPLLRAQVRANRVPAAPFTLVAVSDSLAEQRQCAELHVADKFGQMLPLRRGARRATPRIRVAYLSADFHEHATAHLTARLFELHERRDFEVIGVSYGQDDGSPTRKRIAAAFDRFADARELTEARAAELLAEMEVDIAVDLKGHTGEARLAMLSLRPAPLQVTYLGYPGTLGAPWIDYVLADRVVIPPEEQRFYTEKVVYLPDTYQANDSSLALPAAAPSRAAAGLPPQGFVFCCFNNTFKLTAPLFDIWMRLLKQVPGSVLWLIEPTPPARRNLENAARERGIDPARLVFAPRVGHAEHLARQMCADLFLDTLPYNAHTTASDALWAGVPVVTCRGSTFAGRVAASLLGAVGMPELVTRSLADYEALALKLALDRPALAALRAKLAANRSTQPLFDSARFCRAVEAAYRRMWEIHQRGEAPRSFDVPSG